MIVVCVCVFVDGWVGAWVGLCVCVCVRVCVYILGAHGDSTTGKRQAKGRVAESGLCWCNWLINVAIASHVERESTSATSSVAVQQTRTTKQRRVTAVSQ